MQPSLLASNAVNSSRSSAGGPKEWQERTLVDRHGDIQSHTHTHTPSGKVVIRRQDGPKLIKHREETRKHQGFTIMRRIIGLLKSSSIVCYNCQRSSLKDIFLLAVKTTDQLSIIIWPVWLSHFWCVCQWNLEIIISDINYDGNIYSHPRRRKHWNS